MPQIANLSQMRAKGAGELHTTWDISDIAVIKEAESGGNHEEIRPKAMKIRKEHERKIEALLTDAQKKQWKEMLGKPLNLDE